MTERAEIARWCRRGAADGAAYVIVCCDTFDHDDYPVYVAPNEDFWDAYERHNGRNMQRVMEVYDLGPPLDAQLAEHRAFHPPAREAS